MNLEVVKNRFNRTAAQSSNNNIVTIVAPALLTTFILLLLSAGAASAATITVDDSGGADYTSIQAAVNAASGGDVIEVASGTYFENVVVNKLVTLQGESNFTTIIDGSGSGNVVEVTVDGVTVDGFGIQNGSSGIYVISSYNVFLSNSITNIVGTNEISIGADYGFGGAGGFSYGIHLSSSINNTLSGNSISNITGGTGGTGGAYGSGGTGGFGYGIHLSSSTNNTLSGNIISNMTGGTGGTGGAYGSGGAGGTCFGIHLSGSTNNTLSGNIISNMTGGTGGTGDNSGFGGADGVVFGVFLDSGSYQNIININNTVDGDSIIYFYDFNGGVVENYVLTANSNPTNLGKIVLINSRNMTIGNNTISNFTGMSGDTGRSGSRAGAGDTCFGIYLSGSTNNTLSGNTISNMTGGTGGIAGYYGFGGTGGDGYGIYLSGSTNNTFSSNTISNTTGGTGGTGVDHNYEGVNGVDSGVFLDSGSYQNIININNTVDGDSIIYFYDFNGGVVENYVLTANSNPTNLGKIVLINSRNMTIGNNTISNFTSGFGYSIYLYSSSNNTLTSNNALNNNGDGIYLYSSSNNTLKSNTASGNNGDGISLDYSSNNTLTSNNVSDHRYDGIKLHFSSNNTLMSNTVSDVSDGISLDWSNYNTLTNNTVSNNYYGIWLMGGSYNTLTNNTANMNEEIGIRISSSFFNMLKSNNLCFNNRYGLLMDGSNYNTLTNNIANSNIQYGIYLSSSSNNTLMINTVNSNIQYGIKLYSDSNTNIIYNNYFNNTNNVFDDGNNIWNATKKAGSNIIGGSWLGGNYWSDYAGNDMNGDGLGDILTPYNSSGGIINGGDYHPLFLDTTVPTIIVPSNITADATGILTIVSLGTPVVSDNADPSPSVTNDAPLDGFPIGITNVTWTATDASGNSVTSTQTVTITDTTPPVINIVSPQNGTTLVTSVITITGTASDASDVALVTVNGDNATGTTNWGADVTLINGENNITIVSTDDLGNTRSVVLTVYYNPSAVIISIGSAEVPSNSLVTIPVSIANATNITGISFDLFYNSSVVSVDSIAANNSFIGSSVSSNVDNINGTTRVVLTNTNLISSSTQTPFIDVTFNVTGEFGSLTNLDLENVELSNSDFNPDTPASVVDGLITVGINGDLNNNGYVDIGDVAKVAFMVAGKVPEELSADFNNNGYVDIGDAAKIAFYLAGKVGEL